MLNTGGRPPLYPFLEWAEALDENGHGRIFAVDFDHACERGERHPGLKMQSAAKAWARRWGYTAGVSAMELWDEETRTPTKVRYFVQFIHGRGREAEEKLAPIVQRLGTLKVPICKRCRSIILGGDCKICLALALSKSCDSCRSCSTCADNIRLADKIAALHHAEGVQNHG